LKRNNRDFIICNLLNILDYCEYAVMDSCLAAQWHNRPEASNEFQRTSIIHFPPRTGYVSVLIGLATLAVVGLLVFEFKETSFLWGAIGIASHTLAKRLVRPALRISLLRQGRRAAIGPGEWTTYGIGYCFAASTFLAASVAGEGWVNSLFAVFFAAMAPRMVHAGITRKKMMSTLKAF
jgi:hypothetical protein